MRKLEAKYARELVVIGIHSPKFPAEKRTETIRRAVFRHRLEHPVVNDADMVIWQRWGARAWPTIVILGPYGNMVVNTSERPTFQALDRVIGQLVELFDCEINRAPLPQHEPETRRTGELAFPLRVEASDGRLYVADTGNHRVLEIDYAGHILRTFGCGEPGRVDGRLEQACFNEPAGICRAGDDLYVADVESHAIRTIALSSGEVGTVAGTGEPGFALRGGPARETSLCSPWAIVEHRGGLVVAMAGNHSLWLLAGDRIEPLAGNGMERLVDGTLRQASFNQPSDLTVLDGKLYVADSEASAVRVVDVENDDVDTVVGLGLFDFGDVDGVGDDVRLQHPLAIQAHDGGLLIADSYNHKIKRLDPTTRECRTLYGDKTPGTTDGDAPRFYEPSGLSIAGGTLFVADQNNHTIRVIDLEAGQTATLRPRPDGPGST